MFWNRRLILTALQKMRTLSSGLQEERGTRDTSVKDSWFLVPTLKGEAEASHQPPGRAGRLTPGREGSHQGGRAGRAHTREEGQGGRAGRLTAGKEDREAHTREGRITPGRGGAAPAKAAMAEQEHSLCQHCQQQDTQTPQAFNLSYGLTSFKRKKKNTHLKQFTVYTKFSESWGKTSAINQSIIFSSKILT